MAKTEGSRTPRAPRARRAPRLPGELQTAIEAARGKKATDMVVLDLRKAGAFTDYFLVCTGANARQVHAIADAVEAALKQAKRKPSHVEGYGRAEWVLLDYFDFIVHIFSPAARAFYGLERLWGSAVRTELPDEPLASPA
jgi:ribosome-associated protein